MPDFDTLTELESDVVSVVDFDSSAFGSLGYSQRFAAVYEGKVKGEGGVYNIAL